ncbi:MAG: histidine kinase N-terminal 7TM domain-containing protein [Candidatus Thermoplasmatota archaeon]|nr:histidine kinase N-terminal 7TM domain-containing protein [Candidatus Thermoplasmatota archaeon]
MSIAWPTYFLVVGIVLQSLLLIYVTKKKIEGRVTSAFIILGFVMIAWQLIYIFQSNAINVLMQEVEVGTQTAPAVIGINHPVSTWDRTQYLFIGFLGPAFLNLVLTMFVGLDDARDRMMKLFLFSFPIVLVVLNGYSLITSTPMVHTEYGVNAEGYYRTTRGMLYWYNVAYNYTFIFMGFFFLIYKSIKPSYRLQFKQALVFLGGVLVAMVGNLEAVFGLGLIPESDAYDMTPTFMMVGTLFFALGILRYKMFIVEPKMEKMEQGESSFDLSMGHSFVVYEDEPNYSVEIFSDLVKHNVAGIAFLPLNPKDVKEKHKLSKTSILMVGQNTSTSVFSYLSLDDRDYMEYITRNFSSSSSNSIIFLGGLETFAEQDKQGALEFLGSIMKIAEENKSRLLLSINKRISEDRSFKEMFSKMVEL